MILTSNYEELTALKYGGAALLQDPPHSSPIAAPTATLAAVGSLLDRLAPRLSLRTLAEEIEVEIAIQAIVEHLSAEVESHVLASHPADEQSVAAYFDFAHALSVLGRVRDMGQEMRVLVEVITGEPPNEETIESFVFPD